MAEISELHALLERADQTDTVDTGRIESLEEKRDITLPETLKQLLLEYGEAGWGCEDEGEELACSINVQTEAGGDERIDLSEGLHLKTMLRAAGGDTSLVPLFGDGNGNFICLDYSMSSDDAAVVFYDHDYDRNYPVADDFDSFLEEIEIDEC